LEQENVDFDIRNKSGRALLQLAASNGHEDVVKLLLDQENLDINSHDAKCMTSLARGSSGGHDAVVKLLEREDIIPDQPDSTGGTALKGAVAFGTEEVVR